MIDTLLRVSSVLIFFALLHQVFGKRLGAKGGSPRHVYVGKIAIVLGMVIAACVAVRGLHHEGSLTIMYSSHLLAGGFFFAALFATGFYGWKAKETRRGGTLHRRLGYVTLLLLIATLLMGILSLTLHPRLHSPPSTKSSAAFFVDTQALIQFKKQCNWDVFPASFQDNLSDIQ